MTIPSTSRLGRRGFLAGSTAVGVSALLVGCTGNSSDSDEPAAVGSGNGDNAKQGKAVTIGFAAPAADHGWIAAITNNAKSQAKAFKDVTLNAVEGSNDSNTQVSQMANLVSAKVDAIVILPFDGKELTQAGLDAMAAGIPVINLDRIFDTPLAYRTWIGGDNYGMGVSAGNYIAATLKGKSNPVIAEIAGIDSLPLTQARSKGFKDALAKAGMKVSNRVAAEFTVESGEKVTSQLLQAAPKIDAIWNHDDDQGLGVLAAIDNANRDEFFLVGGAGSKNMMDKIKADDSVVKATVTYPPSMSSDAIMLARLAAQGRGMTDLVEPQIPASITVASVTVTKANVDDYIGLAFPS
jgi:ribose transport system substrate-binding protein